jgi:hypothetical protein
MMADALTGKDLEAGQLKQISLSSEDLEHRVRKVHKEMFDLRFGSGSRR